MTTNNSEFPEAPKLFTNGQYRVWWKCPGCGEEQVNRHYGKLRCVGCLEVVAVSSAPIYSPRS